MRYLLVPVLFVIAGFQPQPNLERSAITGMPFLERSANTGMLQSGKAGMDEITVPETWWDTGCRYRTTVTRSAPFRDTLPRPVEIAIDFPLLLERAGVGGEFDPNSLRVIDRTEGRMQGEVPCVFRSEFDARVGRESSYLAWMATPGLDRIGVYEVYFDTRDRGMDPPPYEAAFLPPVNLLENAGFEQVTAGQPDGWKVPADLASVSAFEHSTGKRSLKLTVDGNTPEEAKQEVVVSQMFDVQEYAGQEMVFHCNLLAGVAAYGVPLSIELQQFREDGTRIRGYAVQPRWLSLELARGQLVQLCERGKFSPEAASVKLVVRMRLYVRDSDTGEKITGPDSYFTVWLDDFVVRPGERWEWPPRSNAGFSEGALEGAPLNRGFEFTGMRRLVFNGASEGTMTTNTYGDARSVHWGLEAGTLEFWCRPSWDSENGTEHIFFEGVSRSPVQSRLRKLDASGGNQLEFTISDSEQGEHILRAPAMLKAGKWHHIAASWDFPGAHLQLYVDGKRVAEEGPGKEPWPSSLAAINRKIEKGAGISMEDSRSLPMQAYIGGDFQWSGENSAHAVIDEFRVSDIQRYRGNFSPSRREFRVDEHTRALFHLENEVHGIHVYDDRYIRGHLASELDHQSQVAVLETKRGGTIARSLIMVRPRAAEDLFDFNRTTARMNVTRPFRELPDPRFIEYRQKNTERIVHSSGDPFTLNVDGNLDPWMCSVTFEHAEDAGHETVLLPRWRANNNVVPFSMETLAATLAPEAENDAEKAFEVFKYMLKVTNYYNGGYCETFPERHRSRISYAFIKALNIYPYEQCGPLGHRLRKLFLAAGISSTQTSGTTHEFEQAFYDGSFRLYDPSVRQYWLGRDNKTIISRREMEDDPYLKLRQGGTAYDWLPGLKNITMFKEAERPHDMSFPMRAGERVSICWHNEGRWIELAGNREPVPLGRIPPYYGNGAIVYQPVAEGEAAELDNLDIRSSGKMRIIRPGDPAKPASLVYSVRCPYILSDGRLNGTYQSTRIGSLRVLLSVDRGETWKEAWSNPQLSGEIGLSLLEDVTARYEYLLKLVMDPGDGASVSDMEVRTTFVVASNTLPGALSKGENYITFVGPSPAVPVRTTCSWTERHRAEAGVALNSISYYMNDDKMHRNLFVAEPGGRFRVNVGFTGHDPGLEKILPHARVSLEGLPAGWTCEQGPLRGENGHHAITLHVPGASEGDIRAFDVVVHDGSATRIVPAQVLVAASPLVREAEAADEITGMVSPTVLPEASGAEVVRFSGEGRLGFDLTADQQRTYALWVRARWDDNSSTAMELTMDRDETRAISATSMIGFTHWTSPDRAYAKMFHAFGEQYGHWSWYRIGDVKIAGGSHRLTLSAKDGAHVDALMLLPQTEVMDRAAMNLFQNWNYAPWRNPY